MSQSNTKKNQESKVTYEILESLVREHIQSFVQELLIEEVEQLLGRKKSERRPTDAIDTPQGYRNGFGKPRNLGLMGGTIKLRRPRVRGLEERFESKVLPLFKRRSQEVGDMLPELYLHGLSSGDFELALRGLLGDGAPLSASSILRLKAKWEIDYSNWKNRDLSGLHPVYFWADGIYVKAGLEAHRSALLVVIAALSDGSKVLLACEAGERESKESWLKILRNLVSRGLQLPRLTIADGALGLWSALGEIHPKGDEQRCWNHKIINVLDDLPKKEQPKAAELLKQMPYAPTKEACESKRDEFVAHYKKTCPKATATLLRDWERMVTFYSYPDCHWKHIRTSNVVESPFCAIRLRTDASRRYKRVEGAQAIIWKLLTVAESNWIKLNGTDYFPLLAAGRTFKDGKVCDDKNGVDENDQDLDAA